MVRGGASSSSSFSSFALASPGGARLAIVVALLAMAHVTLCVPVAQSELAQTAEVKIGGFGFGDWLEGIKSKIGQALEEAEQKAKDLVDGIQVVGKDAWEKIKEAAKGIEIAKDKFVERILPKILEALKAASVSGGAAAETVIDALVDLLKELGTSALEKALSYIASHREDIEKKIYEIITARIIAAINQLTGIDMYSKSAKDIVNDDKLKLVLIKLMDRCGGDDDAAGNAAALLVLEPFGLRRAVAILRDMKIENPVDADLIEALDGRLQAAAAAGDAARIVRPFRRNNIFEEILNKIIAKAQEDPVGVARIIIDTFAPLGKDVLLIVVNSLRKMLEEAPSDALRIIVEMLEKALQMPKKITKTDVQKYLKIGKESKDILDALPSLVEEALDSLIGEAGSLKEVENKFVGVILPTLIALVDKLAGKSSEAAAKIAEMAVSLLRRLGSRAIKAAIEWVDSHAESMGDRLHDFLLQRLQDALAEISYVRERGFEAFVVAVERGRA